MVRAVARKSGVWYFKLPGALWGASYKKLCRDLIAVFQNFSDIKIYLYHLGKCYMTCNDTGYQAIEFDAETHLPM